MSDQIVKATSLSRIRGADIGPSTLVLGDHELKPPKDPKAPLYWFVVVDLRNLEVAVSFTFEGNDTVPPELEPYIDNDDYLIFLQTSNQESANLPQGELRAYLRRAGSGLELERAQQMVKQLGTKRLPDFSYCLAATCTEADEPGFEVFAFHQPAMLTMQFRPVEVDNQMRYAPTRL